jgi:hypothetical protein
MRIFSHALQIDVGADTAEPGVKYTTACGKKMKPSGRTLLGCRKCLHKVIDVNQDLTSKYNKAIEHLQVIRMAADPLNTCTSGEYVGAVLHHSAPAESDREVVTIKRPEWQLGTPKIDPERLKRHKRETFLHDRGVQLGQVEPLMAVHPEVQHGPTPDDES